ncbi:hypothetical protein GWI33_012071 [Rhynchophorus ferrugineus]|uniref:Uncharacterized protein n=1 Tax=Rhynchophorus ferrugineus TaxID=354439 RepID=A0A834MCS6_RHYFE|nr:hypothetical protein GWI33_012071 [Rhynchophorus ferrugineus]
MFGAYSKKIKWFEGKGLFAHPPAAPVSSRSMERPIHGPTTRSIRVRWRYARLADYAGGINHANDLLNDVGKIDLYGL